MTGKDARVDAYLATAAPFARPILNHLRKLVHQACPEAVETLRWSMPRFTFNGRILCGMAEFKAHCTFGFWHQDMEKRLVAEGYSTGEAMGLLGRITALTDLPDEATMLGYIRTAATLSASDKPARPRAKNGPRPEARVPDDLTAALKRNAATAKTFRDFPAGQRREYVEWITEARRPETRAKRLETTIQWLAEGKRRNWKYENC
jgi:uncharacterized protein YdeI (YjbR/CyaY-like superfamily)